MEKKNPPQELIDRGLSDIPILEKINEIPPPPFNFDGTSYFAKCMRVVDGDTYIIAVIDRGIPVSFKCRANGFNVAESRRYKGITDEELEKGKMVKTYVTKLLEGKIILVTFKGVDKYGRPMIDVILERRHRNAGSPRSFGGSLCEHLIEHGYAKEYNGAGEKEW